MLSAQLSVAETIISSAAMLADQCRSSTPVLLLLGIIVGWSPVDLRPAISETRTPRLITGMAASISYPDLAKESSAQQPQHYTWLIISKM